MNKLLIQLCIFSIFQSCSDEKTGSTAPYFSVPGFIKEQVQLLDSSKHTLTRKVTFKGNTEEMTIREPDWEKELKPFTECDLNLPAWRNGFQIDTTYTDGVKRVRYKALEKRIAIRELNLDLTGDSIHSLHVVYLKSNTWYSLGRTLTFMPGKGYTIIIEQDTPLQAAEKIRLEGRFQ